MISFNVQFLRNFLEKETTQWTEYGLELAQRQTAVQYQVTCRAVGFDVTNVSASVTSSRSVNCTRNKKICKGEREPEATKYGDGAWVKFGTRPRPSKINRKFG